MQKAAAHQRSVYLTALSQEIERKLQKALNSPSQRLQLLQQLFADIALEIDDRAREIILSKDEDKVTDADEITESRLCFYDVMANHFVIKPENGQRILNLIVLLWSQSFASHIFSLLFHKWVCIYSQVIILKLHICFAFNFRSILHT
ncbi:uncharacterized protein LOC110036937 [Phalaenopsis equestris]|uniref:uncharacterized protein LOC110036937 n=1 Tax=Phalaenopsis equestris TaxID=78828 RepID=UPI0009E619AB|nr:uncharacterized protein LOC110036937 [Phalaenopsis equestris]